MVQVAYSILIATAIASSALAQGTYASHPNPAARDVASAETALFGRAALKVVSELYTREELSEIFGRDVDELSLRDLDELFDRDTDAGEAPAAAVPPAEAEAAVPPAEAEAGATPAAAPAPPAPGGLNIFALMITKLSTLFHPAPPSGGSTPLTTTSPSSPAGPPATPAAGSEGAPPEGASPGDLATTESPEAAGTNEARAEWEYEEPIERSLAYYDAGQLEELAERDVWGAEGEWEEGVFRRALEAFLLEEEGLD